MAFHWKDNWYFERLEKGVVRIYHLGDYSIADEDIEIDADSWTSIMASVSARGETAESFQEARDFHHKGRRNMGTPEDVAAEKYFAPPDKGFCLACGGEHIPDPPDSWVDFKGYRFHPPFRCMCCGKEICMRQFAFGRCCGTCDIGTCQSNNQSYRKEAAHDHPSWWSYNAHLSFQKFVQTVGAEPLVERDEDQAQLFKEG